MIYIFAFLKNVVYGTSIFFTQGLTKNVDVLDVLALRFLMSFAVLWVLKVTGVLKIKVGIRELCTKRHRRAPFIKALLLAALFEPVLYMLFETLGVSMTTGITAGVLLSLNPISGCIAESLILKEKTTTLQKFFLGIGIVGVIYIAVNTNTSTGQDTLLGIIFILLAVVTGSLYLVFSRKSSSSFSSMEITYVSAMLGMIAFNFINIVRHIYSGNITKYFVPYMSAENITGFVFLAVISTIVATGMNNYALRKMQVSTMSAFGGISTLVTIAVGVIFRGEHLEYFHFIGLVLIVARMVGVSYIDMQKHKFMKN